MKASQQNQNGEHTWNLDSVNALILADKSDTKKDISEQVEISVGTAHKKILFLGQLLLSSQNLRQKQKQRRVHLSQLCLPRLAKDAGHFQKKFIMCNEI